MTGKATAPERIHILFGGTSNERLVSVASAQNIADALPGAELWFQSRESALFRCARDALMGHKNPFKEEFPVSGRPDFISVDAALAHEAWGKPGRDILVLALHGAAAEDGSLQTRLEKAGVAFTGSGARASASAFDKLASKKVALQEGIRTARYVEITPRDAGSVSAELKKALLAYERLAVKPVADGSSLGLHLMDGRSDVAAVARELAHDGRRYLIEEFLAGTELTVGVIGQGDDARALPPSEVRLDSGMNFDYDAKYLGKGAEELTPARISAELTRKAQDLAVRMHRALGCEGYSRTDLIVVREGAGFEPVFLETNTLPGMTRASFFPQQLAATGSSVRAFFEAEIARAWRAAQPTPH